MFTEKNVKTTKNKNNKYPCEMWIIRNKDFTFTKSKNSVSVQEFLNLANKKYIEKFGKEAEYNSREFHKKSKEPLDPFILMCYNRFRSMQQRCINGKYANEISVQNNAQHISYKKRKITLEMTREEFVNWMLENRHIHEAIVANGDISSVDRINENEGYKIGNLQLLALHKNIQKRFQKGEI